MKSRWFAPAACAALALVFLLPAPARSDDGTHGAVVAIVSGGSRWLTSDGIWRRFAFTARQYDLNNYVEGEWQLVAGATILHGTVTCLTIVDDHNARVGARVDDAKFTSFLPGSDVGWIVADAGEGGSNSTDLTSNLRAFINSPSGSAANFCDNGTLPFSGSDLGVDAIDSGNFQIIRLR